MTNIDIIRAWKDEEYRNSLSEEQRSQLPENPAGTVELTDAEMEVIGGGIGSCFACGTHHCSPPPPPPPNTFLCSTQVLCPTKHILTCRPINIIRL